ncbi:MAG: methionyl-tRNA formyltransferase [Pseudomonadota bacterium]
MSALRLAFAGTPDFAAQHLRAVLRSHHETVAILTQPDRRAGRGKKIAVSAVKEVALEAALPVLQPPSLRDESVVEQISALNLDVLIVVAYGLILPSTVLAIPRYGCLNVHGSVLPRWRGAAPIQRAIEAGDGQSGVTIMRMDEGLDTGPILEVAACEIGPRMTSGDLYLRLADLGPPVLLNVLDSLPEVLASAEAQDDSKATLATKISKSEALIDWAEPANVLARRIRAFNPNPGCYSFLAGERVKFWQAQRSADRSSAAPGTIIRADGNGIFIACSDGVLVLDELQLPGGRAMSPAQLLQGNSELFTPGNRFELDGPS